MVQIYLECETNFLLRSQKVDTSSNMKIQYIYRKVCAHIVSPWIHRWNWNMLLAETFTAWIIFTWNFLSESWLATRCLQHMKILNLIEGLLSISWTLKIFWKYSLHSNASKDIHYQLLKSKRINITVARVSILNFNLGSKRGLKIPQGSEGKRSQVFDFLMRVLS